MIKKIVLLLMASLFLLTITSASEINNVNLITMSNNQILPNTNIKIYCMSGNGCNNDLYYNTQTDSYGEIDINIISNNIYRLIISKRAYKTIDVNFGIDGNTNNVLYTNKIICDSNIAQYNDMGHYFCNVNLEPALSQTKKHNVWQIIRVPVLKVVGNFVLPITTFN